MAKNRDDRKRPETGGESRYGEELLSANWNPVIDLLAWSCEKTLDDVSSKGGDDMTDKDIDTFLCRVYTLGS